MAGDWIKLRIDLREDPEVFQIAALTGLDRFNVVGRLATFWGWIDRRSVDGRVDGVSRLVVDEIVGFSGFAEALETVKWLVVDGSCVYIPKHDKNTTQSGKERSLKNERQAKWRAKKALEKAANVDVFVGKHVDLAVDATPSTGPSTREEKRREELKSNTSAAKLPTCPSDSIVALYHEILPELPGIRVMDKERTKAISDFWKWVLTTTRPDGTPRASTAAEALDWTRDYFNMARNNDFIMGRSSRPAEHANWRCSIEYLLSTRGMKKVIEETKEAA